MDKSIHQFLGSVKRDIVLENHRVNHALSFIYAGFVVGLGKTQFRGGSESYTSR
jgi:hypothetical protein